MDEVDKNDISLNTMCQQAFYDAIHDFGKELDKNEILKHVEFVTPCEQDISKKTYDEDDFLKQILLKPEASKEDLNKLKKIETSVKNISDTIEWNEFIKKNYNIYSAYRPSFSRPCDGVDLKEQNKGKSIDDIVKNVVTNCSTIPNLNTEEYWKTSYIQDILYNKSGIQNDVFFICDTAKGNIKHDLYFADTEKNQTFYWLQTPQTIFDPALKTTWNTDSTFFKREKFKFAWQTALPGAKQNYLYPQWDKNIDETYEPSLNHDTIEKLICSNTNSYMITSTDNGKELLPNEQHVSFYIQQPDNNKYVYADNKSSAKSSVNNICKSPNSDYINLAQRYIFELFKHVFSTPGSFTQPNTQSLIAQYTEPYMLMAKRFGDASQAAACCQQSIPFNEPNDKAYIEPTPKVLTEQHIDKQIKMTNGNHALISYDRICVATGLIFLAPIVIYSLEDGFIVFTKKTLSSVDTRIKTFFENSELKCKKLLGKKRPNLVEIIQEIKSQKIGGQYTISDVRDKIKTICDITINSGLKHDGKSAHIPNWLRLVKNKKTNTYLKQHIDIKKSRNEAFRLFIGLIISLSKYLLDLHELENNYKNYETFLNEQFGIEGFNFTQKIEAISKKYPQYKEEMSDDDKKQFLKDLIEIDNNINVFIKETENVKKQSDLLFDILEEFALMTPIDTDEAKIELLQKLLPKNFNHNMNNFDLYDSMQSRLSVRQAVRGAIQTVGKILKGKREPTSVDKKLSVLKEINNVNLTEINKVLGLDTFTLAAWRELKKTNNEDLIEIFKTKTINFYESVFKEQYDASILKFTNRQLEKKSAAEEGINILRREFGIQTLQTGGNDDLSLKTAKNNNNLKSIVSRLYPILLYQLITNNAKNGEIDSKLFQYIDSKGNQYNISIGDLLGYINRYYLFKNITPVDLYTYNIVDNTPFVFELFQVDKKVESNGCVYLQSPMYSLNDGNDILEEIFIGEEQSNKTVKIPLYMIFKHIPTTLYTDSKKLDPTDCIEFSYTLPQSYYMIEDNFDIDNPIDRESSIIRDNLKLKIDVIRDIFGLRIDNIVDYNSITTDERRNQALTQLINDIYPILHRKRIEYEVEQKTENRNIHRIFVEDNQLQDIFSSIEEAYNNNDIPAIISRYFIMKNSDDYENLEEFSNEFKEEVIKFIFNIVQYIDIEITENIVSYRYIEEIATPPRETPPRARGIKRTRGEEIAKRMGIIEDPKQSIQKRQRAFMQRQQQKSKALRTTRRLQRAKQTGNGKRKTKKYRR